MAQIAIINDGYGAPFEGEQYVVDLDRSFEGYEEGDIICNVSPFHDVNLELTIAIRRNGSIVFRHWTQGGNDNPYLHYAGGGQPEDVTATPEQIDTVNGLFSGRIEWEGLKLTPGATLQKICPINVQREEERIGKTIYLA